MKKSFLILLFWGLHQISFSQTIEVPIDHKAPDNGTFNLNYEFGEKFNPALPTVILVSDAQQFYIQRGRIKKIQEDIFGDKFNVLGIIPRSNVEGLRKPLLNENGDINWKKAYSIFNSFQYASDIEFVIKNVLKGQKKIFLYGVSGGAFLVAEYLSTFPNSEVSKVFIGASVNSIIQNKLGIMHDNFKRDFLDKSPSIKEKLNSVIAEKFFSRELIASLLQRQNFFVKLDSLNIERKILINKLYNKDTASIEKYKNDYQVNAINDFLKSDYGIPIRVRLFEFIAPLLDNLQMDENQFYPEMDNSFNIAKPLVDETVKSKIIFHPTFNIDSARNFNGEVFILSGRFDHVVDYRTSIYLSAIFKNSTLLITRGNHMFSDIKSENNYNNLVRDFFLNKSKNSNWFKKYEKYKWFED